MTASGIHDLIKQCLIALGVSNTNLVAILDHGHHIGFKLQINATFNHACSHHIARLFVKAAQDLRTAIELRCFDPQAIHDAGEFRSDIASPHDQDRFRQFFQMEHLVRGDRQLRTGEFWNSGPAARGNQDVLCGLMTAIRQRNSMRVDQGRTRIIAGDATVFQQVPVDPLQPVQLCVQFALESLPVKDTARDIPAIGLGIPHHG